MLAGVSVCSVLLGPTAKSRMPIHQVGVMSEPQSTDSPSSSGTPEETPKSPRLLYWSEHLIAPATSEDVTATGLDGAEVDRNGRPLMKSVHALNGTLISVSPSCVEVLGYEAREIVGTNFFALLHPGDEADLADSYQCATHIVETVRYRVRKKEGDFIWLESAFSKVTDPDGRVGVEVVSHDVTDQYNVEHALRRELDFSALVLEAADVHVIVVDRDGRIVRCNRPALWKPDGLADEIVGRHVFDLLQDESAAEESELAFESLRADDFPNERSEYWGHMDTTVSVEWHNSAITDSDGVVEYVVGIGVDPTEQRQLEHAVLRTLEEERRRIGQDLHDGLGQLLVGITMIGSDFAARLAERGYPEADRATELVELAKRADHMAHGLARGLIPIGDGERGLASALHSLSADIERIFRIRCRCHIEGAVDEIEREAANDLFFIAQEAVSNAIKHAHARTVGVRLSVRDGQIRLTIENDGRPFAEETAGTGVEQWQEGRSPSGGLGTAIMHYRGRRLGGALSIEMNSLGNTVVVVQVPQ